MACLSLTAGPLLPPDVNWQQVSLATTANGTTITFSPGGPTPGVVVANGMGSQPFSKPPSGNIWFAIWGTTADFVAVLTVDDVTPSLPSTRTVVIVDLSKPGLPTQIALMIPGTSANPLPHINKSAGNGAVALLWGGTGSGPLGTVFPAIIRSANGDVLCSAVPFTPSGQVNGDVTATQLQIKDGGTIVASAPRPSGSSEVTPDPRTFPEAVVGGDPSVATSVRQFTITNDGDDCLTVSAIGNLGAYTVVATSRTLPATFDPGQTMTVDVRFAPAAAGTFNSDLPVTRSPAVGDGVLKCRGTARLAVRALSFSGSVTFGSVAVGASRGRTLTLDNTGDLPVTVTVPASPAGSDFSWAALTTTIPFGGDTPLSLTFAPTTEGSQNTTLTFTSNAPTSPHSVMLSGVGCVPRAMIDIPSPPGPTISFSTVERGFRMVRVVRVTNAGNGQLTFRASTSGSSLFGIVRDGGSFVAPNLSETFTLDPVTPCGVGSGGSGELLFGVVFFADQAPGPASGTLTIDNHNAPTGPASFTFALTADVTAVINEDVELVLDRSGSMGDPSGSRTKIATTIDAARLFVQLMRPDVDDRLGIVRFNSTPEVLSSITDVTAGSQPSLVAAINSGDLAPTGGTCIAGGVIVAIADREANPRATTPADLRRIVVALTDGFDNVDYVNPADGVTYSLLGESGTTALSVPAGTRLYGIGIGDSIDAGRLGQLAQATSGAFLQVREFTGLDYFMLEKHFTQIYMDAVDLATIQDPVLTIDPGETHVIDFDVLRGDVGCMIVIYDRDGIRIPFHLETPAGELIDITSVAPGFQIRTGVTATARFVEVKFPLTDPTRYAGVWKLVVKHDGRACFTGQQHETGASQSTHYDPKDFGPGFQPLYCKPWGNPITYGFAIGVGSNFRMMPYVDPGIVSVGEPIQLIADIAECGFPVLGCTVTVSSRAPDGTVRSHTLPDDGAHGDGAANDGSYGHRFLQTYAEGTYEFTFRATGYSRDGEPVVREAVRAKYVQGRVPLVPPPGTGGGGKDIECCQTNQRWLRVIAVLLFLAVLLLILIWRS